MFEISSRNWMQSFFLAVLAASKGHKVLVSTLFIMMGIKVVRTPEYFTLLDNLVLKKFVDTN